jgi:hypothetical protein
MADNKLINRLRLMLDHAKRAMEQDEPDLKIVEKLLADALALAIGINEPPDPYADKTLRPGLNYIDPTGRFPEPQENTDG